VKNLLLSIRLPECLLVLCIGVLSFSITNTPLHTPSLVALFFITASTMLQNGWRDRYHDIKKGKTVSKEIPYFFVLWLCFFWVLSLLLVLAVYSVSKDTGIFMGLMIVIGLVYSEVRSIPLASISLVVLTVSSVTLLPFTFGASFLSTLPLFLTVFLLMLGRENLHDIADVKVDTGYKKSIPIIFGEQTARNISLYALLLGSLSAVLLTSFAVLGFFFVVYGCSLIKEDTALIRTRCYVDIGLVLLALSLFFT
jgi:4-hydroxybenzoate polyprenyltransferase